MADSSDDDILNELYPEKAGHKKYEERKISETAKAISYEKPEETYTRAAKESYSGAKESAGGFFGAVGKAFEGAKERVAPSKETRERNLEEAYENTKGDAVSDDNFEIADLNKDKIFIKKSQEGDFITERDIGKVDKRNRDLIFTDDYHKDESLSKQFNENKVKHVKNIQDAEWKRVGALPGAVAGLPGAVAGGVIAAKGALSESKLKWEASKYGISPDLFNEMKKTPAGVTYLQETIEKGKSRDAGLKHAAALDEKTKAETAALRAQASQRYAKAEQMERGPATVPQGGRRLVQFGWKEGSFGQEPTYVNAAGLHGQIRNQFMPGKASGVSSTLANSRLEIAKMKSRVLSGTGGGSINAVQSMQPNSRGYGAPSVINKLAGSHSNPVSKLAPYGQPKLGPSILDKLSANKRRPWR